MLEGCSIICFAHDWEGDPTSKTHIMRILARRNRVLWVNSIAMRRPTASRSDLRRMVAKLQRGLVGCRQAEPNLFVASPLVLPLPGVAWADFLNAAILPAWLRRCMRSCGLERPIVWSFLPNVGRLLGKLGERLAVYHCVDEYAAFSGVPRSALVRMERDLLVHADIVFTSSERLCEERRPLNPHTHFIPHGVDVGHFSRALDPETEIPADVLELRGPVVGFFGLIADWVDLDLVRRLAQARPLWQVVLIGKAVTDLAPLRGLANVHLLGQRPYATLPGYCRKFDVAIIPFRMNELTVRANPLKMREYLAAGLPVISSPLPEVARYRDRVALAAGEEGFLAAIESALGERTASADRRRVEAMRAEAWEARVEDLSRIIARQLDAPPAARPPGRSALFRIRAPRPARLVS